MLAEMTHRERVFQIAAWMWLAYLICLAVLDQFIYAGRPMLPVWRYHLLNGLPALVFLAAAYANGLKKRWNVLAPGMILLISTVPILSLYLFDVRLPPAPLSNIEGMVLRQLPVLFIGLVLVAWRYNLRIIVLYSVGIHLFEFAIAQFPDNLFQASFRLIDFAFILLVRTVCLVVTGIFINLLITRLRQQQADLQAANRQLSHYASTLESLTVSRERNRMSRELHDTVVHTLSGLAVQLETTQAYLEIQPETARGLLDQSLQATRAGLQETRRAIKSLRASPLDDLGLVKAIHSLAEIAAQRGRFRIELSLPEHDPFLTPDVEQGLYRVAQEALENVVRHANAQQVRVHLALDEDEIELVVADDGLGFNPNNDHRPGHFGLAGMKERADLICGVLTITSQPKAGTTVRLVVKGYKA